MSKFDQEQARAARLMQRLGQAVDSYEDPNTGAGAAGESGADVVAVISARRFGLQVTDLDTGGKPGKLRAAESKAARAAQAKESTYFVSAENDTSKLVEAIARSIERKSRMSFSGIDEFWLLICAGVPTTGAIGATFAMTPWLTPATLDATSLSKLESSKYTRAFVHAVLGVEEQVLFEWRRGLAWSKSTVSSSREQDALSFSEHIRAPELWRDPGAWFERQLWQAVDQAKKATPP